MKDAEAGGGLPPMARAPSTWTGLACSSSNQYGGAQLAKPNYQYEKRQRDLAKKKKKDEKRQRKLEKKDTGGGDSPAPSAEDGNPPVEGQ
jgi:hypothetical protein